MQPLSAYNISRKELHNLLMKQQATASELDNQRDQTLKYAVIMFLIMISVY